MNSDIKFYFSLFMQRLPVMMVMFVLCAGIGVGLAMTMPPQYRADAKLLVESAQISEDSRDSRNQPVAAERLQVIEERLMTRSNLIDIANRFGVFEDAREMNPDTVVTLMRALTEIWISSGRDRATLMTISFTSERPDVAANVVNQFVTLVLEEDVDTRLVKAEERLKFYEQQVENLDEELVKRSAEIVAFKEANKDALPDGLAFRLDRQSQLQERVNLAARDRTALIEQKNRLIAVAERSAGPANQLSPEQRQLVQAKDELAAALVRYSDEHPTVVFLQKKVEKLEAMIAPDADDVEGSSTGNSVLDLQLTEIDSRIASIDEEVKVAERELERLQVAIERTPENAIRLESFEREYERSQALYTKAAADLNNARVQEQIEVLAKGERITPIEQATVPTEPFSPNRKLIAGGGVFAGTALATVFFVLAELINRTIRRPVDLTRALGVQPLATIPYIESSSVRRRRVALKTILVVVILISVPLALWFVHVQVMPLDLFFDKVLGRLGL